jgi:DNA-binding NarL/FixJ family response regulator
MHDNVELRSNWPPVIVADPRSFMRGCLGCWLKEFGNGFQPVIVADAVAAIDQKSAPGPGAVILSASSRPKGRAWLEEQTAGLRDVVPEVPIVAILDEPDLAAGQETALALGLQGFIPMSSSLEIAAAALRLVIVGGRYYPQVAATASGQANGAASQPRPAGKLPLTPREQAVFDLLSAGLPNKLIARQLGMALSTVKIHVHHILAKLNVQNRTEVAIWGRVIPWPVTEQDPKRPASRQIVVHEMR